MKTKFINLIFSIIFILLIIGKTSNAQTFDVYIANDYQTSATVYEFDVFLKSTNPSSWAFRSIQFGFYVNPSWLPAGPAPTINIVPGSSTLNFYTPGLIQMNASPSLSAFQIASNAFGSCGTNTIFSTNGFTVKIGRIRITSNSGPINCAPANISMIRPIAADVAPGNFVNLKMAVTKWTDVNCGTATPTTISANGTYTSIAGNTLLSEFNNMKSPVSGPSDALICEGTTAAFSVMAFPLAGMNSPITYQWFENGVSMSGQQASTLSIPNASINLDGHLYYCIVNQCNSTMSRQGLLSFVTTNDGDPCTIDACESSDLSVSHTSYNPDDGNICTTDGCNSITGPFHTLNNFDDGNPATIDACDSQSGVYHYYPGFSGIAYQAVARNSSGDLISNQNISIRFKIHDAAPNGTIDYQEVHNLITNSLGLFSVNIGHGTNSVGVFSAIDWSGGIKFLQVELDTNGGNTFTDMGTQQLMTVPFAMYAVKSGSINNKVSFSSYLGADLSLSASALTQIVFNNAQFNYGNGFNSSTGKFTAPTTGVYQFSTNIYFFQPGLNLDALVKYFKNNNQVMGGQAGTTLSSSSSSGNSLALTLNMYLTQGDVIDVHVQQNGSGPLSIFGGGVESCTFSGFKVD